MEDHYRNEKVVLEIEKFHGKTPNNIRQELFAVVIMFVIARTLMVLTSRMYGPKGAEFQFKNAVMTLASEAAVLVPEDPSGLFRIFSAGAQSNLTGQALQVKNYQSLTTQGHQKTSQQMAFREEGKAQRCLIQQH